MKTFITTIIFFFGSFNAQEISNDYLEVFKGDWTGTLTYLNYSDEKTRVTLALEMTATFNAKGLKFDYKYDEGNGRFEKRTGSFKLRKSNVAFNGLWDMESFEAKDLQNWTLKLSSKGKDNNRPASFRKTVEVTPEKIVVTKMVKFDEEDEYFIRNQHIFNK